MLKAEPFVAFYFDNLSRRYFVNELTPIDKQPKKSIFYKNRGVNYEIHSPHFNINDIIMKDDGSVITVGNYSITETINLDDYNILKEGRVGLKRIKFLKDIFVGIGANGLIYSSLDGKKWKSQKIGSVNLWDITYSIDHNLFIVIGDSGMIYISTDCHNWETIDLELANNLKSIIYSNGLFIIVGALGVIITSNDGYDWTLRKCNTNCTLNRIIYNNRYIAVGDLGIILISNDGIKWEVLDLYGKGNLFDINYNDSTMIAVGYPNLLFVSDNYGLNWERIEIIMPLLKGVKVLNNDFFIIGNKYKDNDDDFNDNSSLVIFNKIIFKKIE